MTEQEKQDWYLMLLSLDFNISDGVTKQLPNEQLLQELLEAINENRPGLYVDQYLS